MSTNTTEDRMPTHDEIRALRDTYGTTPDLWACCEIALGNRSATRARTLAAATTRCAQAIAAQHARAMVGCGVFHQGEHGHVIAADTGNYAQPMLRVQFGCGRVATLKPTEVGATL